MAEALKEAHKAFELGEVPVGALVVCNNQVIARAYNIKESSAQAIAHAEVLAIKQASRKLKNWRLVDCELYVTLEPCFMCAGAILSSRIKKLIYGAVDPKAGAVHSLYQVLSDPRLNHSVQVVGGVMAVESSTLLKKFFTQLRNGNEKSKSSLNV